MGSGTLCKSSDCIGFIYILQCPSFFGIRDIFFFLHLLHVSLPRMTFLGEYFFFLINGLRIEGVLCCTDRKAF